MTVKAAPTTRGHCVVCGQYGEGRYVGPINDRAEAIDQHRNCTGKQPPASERPRHYPVGRP